MLNGNFVDELNLIVSDYFFSHERNGIVKYIYDELDIDNKFQLCVCRSHTKITAFETFCGNKIVIHGSANLRSSDNIEQFNIEENKELYCYLYQINTDLIECYKTINKSIGVKKTWQVVGKDRVEVKLGNQQQKKEILKEDRVNSPKF